MNFITYQDLTNCLIRNLNKIPRTVDLIVGIPRSGTMVANILALYLNLPFTDIDNFVNNGNLRTGTTRKCKNWIKEISEAKHVLIVDDSISSGKAIKEAKEILKEVNLDCKMTFLAVYALAVSCKKVDIYFELCEQPRMFEWNFMHHWALEYCCMDIDGVVCEDPTFFQNDDGSKYLDFLKNAKPKFIPTQKVGKFVSCRLEKYRAETEKWLEKYDIQYDELIMLEGVTAKERALGVGHAAFKAKVYSDCDAVMFFESDYNQALDICRITRKPVFCLENRRLITSNNLVENIKVSNKELGFTIKRTLRKITGKLDYVK
jgi:uncharacterized HAD superfamily protein/hypoxanthine phosphoribosyltransferase